MVNPVKNKKCQHYYDQEAIHEVIKARHRNKKKCRYVDTEFCLSYINNYASLKLNYLVVKQVCLHY